MITNNSDILNIYEEVHEVPCDEGLVEEDGADLEDQVEVGGEDHEGLEEDNEDRVEEVDDEDQEGDE